MTMVRRRHSRPPPCRITGQSVRQLGAVLLVLMVGLPVMAAPGVTVASGTDGTARESGAVPASKQRIVFESARDGGYWPEELYSMKPDGTDVHLLINIDPDIQHKDPAWSSDGAYVAYWASSEQLGDLGISRVAARGGGEALLVPRRVPDDGTEPWVLTGPSRPAWSPDDTQLAFDARGYAGATPWIWVKDLRTGGLTKLVEGREAAWSPDGTQLAFARLDIDDPAAPGTGIWIVNADGTGEIRLSSPPATATDHHPDWHPDGGQIVFHRRDGAASQIHAIDVAGLSSRQLTAGQSRSEDPVWAPDGLRIAFHRQTVAGGGPFQIHLMNHDGTGLVQLTVHPNGATSPAWRRAPEPVTDVDIVVLGGSQTFDWWTGASVTGAVSGGVVAELDLMTTGSVERLAGPDRYSTAVAISRASFSAGVPVAYIATGLDYPDALTSGAAAGRQGGPVLLVSPGSIPAVVGAELSRLAPERIVVVGGTGAISATVESALAGYTSGPVTRLGGTDRYGTAAAVSSASFAPGVPVAYVATGENFPDALPSAAAAGRRGGPLLLVRSDAIPHPTRKELARLDPARIVIAGESDVVSDQVAAALEAYTSGPVVRHAGPDRFSTAAAISESLPPVDGAAVFIATGANFPDGVAAVPAAVGASAPLLLVWTDVVPAATRSELIRLGSP